MDNTFSRPSNPEFDSPIALRRYKVALVGDANCGKTAFLQSLQNCTNVTDHDSNGIGISTKRIINDDAIHSIDLWELSPSPKYEILREELYKEADGCFLFYDCTERASFQSLEKWIGQILRVDSRSIPLVLIASKIDLRPFAVAEVEGRRFASQRGIAFCDVSSKTLTNTEKAVEIMLNMLKSNNGL